MNFQIEDIDLFLLDSSSLQPEQCEQLENKMESDPEFALLVAERLLALQFLEQAAVDLPSEGRVVLAPAVSSRWKVVTLLALSACVVAAVGWWGQLDGISTDGLASDEPPGIDQQMVADTWYAVLAESSDEEIEMVGMASPDASEADDQDWMVDAIWHAYDEGDA